MKLLDQCKLSTQFLSDLVCNRLQARSARRHRHDNSVPSQHVVLVNPYKNGANVQLLGDHFRKLLSGSALTRHGKSPIEWSIIA